MHINKESEVFIIRIILASYHIELKAGALKLLQNELHEGTIPHSFRNDIFTDQHLYVKPKLFRLFKTE